MNQLVGSRNNQKTGPQGPVFCVNDPVGEGVWSERSDRGVDRKQPHGDRLWTQLAVVAWQGALALPADMLVMAATTASGQGIVPSAGEPSPATALYAA